MPTKNPASTISPTPKPDRKRPRKGTKIDAIIRLLSRPSGANIAELQKATGWQPHSVRAALTGLRKKGLDVRREKNAKGVTVYRASEAS